MPTPKDEGRLSVDRGSMTTAEAAFSRYRAEGRKSAGVWSVKVGECLSLALHAISDPIEGDSPNPAHAFVDFRGLEKKDVRTKGQLLARMAHERGIQHTA